MDPTKTITLAMDLDSLRWKFSNECLKIGAALGMAEGCKIKISNVLDVAVISQSRTHRLKLSVCVLPNSELTVERHFEDYIKISCDDDSSVILIDENKIYKKALLSDAAIRITDQDDDDYDEDRLSEETSDEDRSSEESAESDYNSSDLDFIDDTKMDEELVDLDDW
jgi:hypothetical protein